MLDADGNVPYVDNVSPFLFDPADYEIYKKPMIHIDSMEVMLKRRSGVRNGN